MATLTIRNLPEETRRALKARAAEHNRSMEAEVRAILEESLVPAPDFVANWVNVVVDLEGDFHLPSRSEPRELDLS